MGELWVPGQLSDVRGCFSLFLMWAVISALPLSKFIEIIIYSVRQTFIKHLVFTCCRVECPNVNMTICFFPFLFWQSLGTPYSLSNMGSLTSCEWVQQFIFIFMTHPGTAKNLPGKYFLALWYIPTYQEYQPIIIFLCRQVHCWKSAIKIWKSF